MLQRHAGDDPTAPIEAVTGPVAPPAVIAPTVEPPAEESLVLGDRYELVEVLGRGGMAEVHRADDRLLGREVAVKLLRDNADSERDRARFIAEARTLAQLSHSGLVMVLDAGITAERPYIVMELVEGPTLAQVLSDGPLDPRRAATIGVQLATALAYAHEHGVVHRDVKPANVLLGVGERVKLADFGIARLIGDTVRQTQVGQAVGTAAYVAPEQVRGDDVDGAADVYSLGLVLLEALTGDRAFPGSATEAALARLHRPPDVPATLPEPWRALLDAMTRMEARDRPTAAQVASALLAASSGPVPPVVARRVGGARRKVATPEPTTVRPVPAGGGHASRRRSWTTVREMPTHQRGVAVAVAAVVLLIVVVAIASVVGSPGGSSGTGSGRTSDGTSNGQSAGGRSAGGQGSTRLPANTPPELRAPLTRLHDAVAGR